MRILYECITGSRLYGTNTPDSDLDLRGIYLPDKYKLIQDPETITFPDRDISYHSLSKFFLLCAENNPNIIELLFVTEGKTTISSNIWKYIQNERISFLSKKITNRFIGYAKEQLHRIKRHRSWLLNPPKGVPKRTDFGLNEQKPLSADQLGAFNTLMKQYLEEVYSLHNLKDLIEQSMGTPDFLGIVQSIGHNMDINAIVALTGLHPNFVGIVQKEKAYLNAMNHWKQYNKWKKERNPERAKLEEKYGYDTKHAMHIFRLLEEGVELLIYGTITFPRPNSDFLLEVKNGKYNYEQLMELIDEERIKNSLNLAKNHSKLPDDVDMEKISKLYRDCILMSEL